MGEHVFISVIVPIYNAEKYLGYCLESILNYGDDIEVICVNDGSTDNSLSICNTYKDKDSRIKVIDQKNLGVSVARNKGIDYANGEWILFIDADDSFTENYYAAVERLDPDCDVGLFSFYKVAHRHLPTRSLITVSNSDSILVSKMLKFEQVDDVVCNLRSPCAKAYKREFIVRNKIQFPKNVIMGEDMIFNIYVYSLAKKIQYFPVAVYCYNRNPSSVTRRFVSGMIEQVEFALKAVKKAIKDNSIEIETRSAYDISLKTFIFVCLEGQIFKGQYSYKEKIALIDKMKNSELLKYGFTGVRNIKDGNYKINIFVLLAEYNLITLLDCMFFIKNKMRNLLVWLGLK